MLEPGIVICGVPLGTLTAGPLPVAGLLAIGTAYWLGLRLVSASEATQKRAARLAVGALGALALSAPLLALAYVAW